MNNEINYAESIELANSKEHLLVIRGNIKTANEELAVLLKNKEDIELQIKNTKDKEAEILKLISEKNKILEDLNFRIMTSGAELNSITENIEYANYRFAQERQNHLSTIREITNSITELDKVKNEKIELIDKLECHYNEISKQIITANNYLSKKGNDTSQLKDELSRIICERDNIALQIKNKKLQLDDIVKQTEIEIARNKDAVSGPLKLLEIREREVEMRESDANILISRLRKVFNQMYPDRTFTM